MDNLLANAVQHTPDRSSVDVRVSTEPGMACFEVSDQGPGIPPAEHAHIFEPFHRADPARARATGGAGLGLTIVSAIAHAHGGTVGVVSDPTADNGSAGATFWVRIPLAGPSTDGMTEAAPAVGRIGGSVNGPTDEPDAPESTLAAHPEPSERVAAEES